MNLLTASLAPLFSLFMSAGPKAGPKARRSHTSARRWFLASYPSESRGESCLALNEPGDKRKDEGY
jgi:hypothetical protein